MASYSINKDNFTFTVNYDAQYDIASDVTTITISSFVWAYYGYNGYSSSYSATVTFSGISVSASGTGVTNGGIKSFSAIPESNIVTVNHGGGAGERNVDISLSAINTHYYRVWVENKAYSAGGYYTYKSTKESVSGSTTVFVGERNRSDINGDAAGDFGEQLTYAITKYIEGTTVKVTANCLGQSETVYQGAGTSVTWTPAVATYAPLLTESVSTEAVVSCETFLDGASIGTSEVSITLTIPDSVKPTISNVSVSDPNGLLTRFGAFVSGKSTAMLTATAAGAYGSTIESYAITIDGAAYSSNPATTPILQNQKTEIRQVPYSVTVTDSRGRSSAAYIGNINLYPYNSPALTNVTVFRSDRSGAEADEGTWFCIDWDSPIFSALPKNQSISITGDVRAGGSSWTNVGQLSDGAVFGGTYDINTTYECRVTIQDSVGDSASYIVTVPTATWVMKFRPNGNGVAFGKGAEEDDLFEVDWKAKFNKGVEGISASDVGAMPKGDTISLQKSDSVFSTQIIAQAITSNISLILPTHSGYIRTIDSGFELPATGEEGAVFFLLTDEEEQ